MASKAAGSIRRASPVHEPTDRFPGEVLGGSHGDRLVEVGDGRDLGAQGCHLAQHEHAFPLHLVGPDGAQLVAFAHQRLGGDAQPTEVQGLQLTPHLLGCGSARLQAGACVLERGARASRPR